MAFLFHYIPVFWGKVNFFLFIYFTEFKLKYILVPQNELFLEEFGAMASASHQKRYVACFEYWFQSLQAIIGGKVVYQSPLPDLAKLGPLCTRYNFYF